MVSDLPSVFWQEIDLLEFLQFLVRQGFKLLDSASESVWCCIGYCLARGFVGAPPSSDFAFIMPCHFKNSFSRMLLLATAARMEYVWSMIVILSTRGGHNALWKYPIQLTRILKKAKTKGVYI